MVIETDDEKSMIPFISARKMNEAIKKTPGQNIPSVKIYWSTLSLHPAVMKHLILMLLNPCLSQSSPNLLARCKCLCSDKRTNDFCQRKTEYANLETFFLIG